MRGAVVVAALAVVAVGCGQPSADLFSVTRGGSISGARLTLRVTDDGHVSCNGSDLREISSNELIRAREVARELEKPAQQVVINIGDNTVRFADNAPGQDPEMYKAALLVRQLAKGPCGLPR